MMPCTSASCFFSILECVFYHVVRYIGKLGFQTSQIKYNKHVFKDHTQDMVVMDNMVQQKILAINVLEQACLKKGGNIII